MSLDSNHNSDRRLAALAGFSQEYIDSIQPTERDLELLSPAARKVVLERHYATRRAVKSVYGDDFDDEEER